MYVLFIFANYIFYYRKSILFLIGMNEMKYFQFLKNKLYEIKQDFLRQRENLLYTLIDSDKVFLIMFFKSLLIIHSFERIIFNSFISKTDQGTVC
jgi:hypothetical protein